VPWSADASAALRHDVLLYFTLSFFQACTKTAAFGLPQAAYLNNPLNPRLRLSHAHP
jgi:hypothetical protein